MATEANIHYGNTRLELKRKVFTLDTSVIGSSFTPTSRMIGNVASLFGISGLSQSKIVSLMPRQAALSPAAMMIVGFFNDNLYLASTQNTILSGSAEFDLLYTD